MIATTVVVVNYRTPDRLQTFVDSYRATAPDDTELFVVDVDPVSPFGWDNVPGNYIIMTENDGYAAACNLASQEAKGSVLAFFNADVELLDGTISRTTAALLDNPDWGVAGPLQYSSAGRLTHAGIFGTLDAPRHRAWQQPVSDQYRDVVPAVTVAGSAIFVKRECWLDLLNCDIWREQYPQTLGAFPDACWLYYEDTMLCYHAHAHGWGVFYLGSAECIHEWHVSINRYGDRHCVAESQAEFRRFCDRHEIIHD